MGFDEIKDKVTGALGDEEKSDSLLDKAEDLINDKTGGKFADQVGKGRDFIDGQVGDEKA
ncbi:MAG: antitoxin [Beutenbergiaceae bacterium]